jgi:hypothetical protein
MRLLKFSVPLVALSLAAIAACDGTNSTNGLAAGGADNESVPTATQPAPNTATQAAPNTATQAAPNTATQSPANTAVQVPPSSGAGTGTGSGSGSGSGQCTAVCNHVASLDCGVVAADCIAECPLDNAGACQSQAQALVTCAMAAANCTALNGCGPQSTALDTCLGGSSTTSTTTNTTTPTISNPSTCNVGTQCGSCTVLCDACICSLQLVGVTQAEIVAGCADYC